MITASNTVTLKKIVVSVEGVARAVLEMKGKEYYVGVGEQFTVTNEFDVSFDVPAKESPWGVRKEKPYDHATTSAKLREALKEFLA